MRSSFVVQNQLTPAQLTSALKTLFDASLTGLWIGEDLITNPQGQLTSWPGRIGGTLTQQDGYFGTRLAGIAGRSAMYDPAGGTSKKSLFSATAGTIATVIACAVPPAIPFTNYKTIAKIHQGDGVGEALVGGIGESTWYPSGTHYKAGIATEDATSGGLTVYQNDGGSFDGTLRVGGSGLPYPNRTWESEITLVLILSSTPSAIQRTEANAFIQRYYGL